MYGGCVLSPHSLLVMTITIFSDLIGALTTLFFTSYCVGLKSNSEIEQLAEIGYLKLFRQLHQPVILSALSLIHLSQNLPQYP